MTSYEGEPPDIAVGELRVARGFNLDSTTFDLQSTAWPYKWTAGDQVAVCQRQTEASKSVTATCPCGCGISAIMWGTGLVRAADHGTVPDPNCACGFYGAYSFDADPISRCPVVGVAEVWGRIRMGTRGVRAEHARLIAVAPGVGWLAGVPNLSTVKLVAAKYGIPYFPDVAAMTADFALVDPKEYGIEQDLEADSFQYTYAFIAANVQAFQASMTQAMVGIKEAYASVNRVRASLEDATQSQPDRPVPKPRVDPRFTTFTGPGRRPPKRIGGAS
jgi:hypothetical protein